MIARGAVRPADGQASGRTPRTLDERIADDIGVARLFGPFAVDLAGVVRRFGCPHDAAEAALRTLSALGIVAALPCGAWRVPLATASQIRAEFALRRRHEPAALADAARVPAERAAALAGPATASSDDLEASLLAAERDGAPVRAAIDGTRRALRGRGLPPDPAAQARLGTILGHLARGEREPAARLHASHLDATAEAMIAQCKLAPILEPSPAADFLRPLS